MFSLHPTRPAMLRILLAAATVFIPLTAPAETTPRKPNIIFILCDDLGYGDIGVFHQNARKAKGLPAISTPAIDKLAGGGIQLRGMYCAAPVCAPSRASLLAGVTQGHSQVRDNQFDKALENNHTLATVLRGAGYRTALIGKWGLHGGGEGNAAENHLTPADWPAYPTKRGFDDFFGYVRHRDGHEHYPKEGFFAGRKQLWENNREVSADFDKCYTTDLFTARAKKWISDAAGKSPRQPFFLMLSYDTPHAVLQLPAAPYPEGGGLSGGLQWTGKPGAMINTAIGKPDSFIEPEYAAAEFQGKPWPDVFRRYATSVTRIDQCTGDLMKLLDDLKIAENTLVIFTSDNGPSQESYLRETFSPQFFEGFGTFDGVKRDCYEGGLRVGALARWPAGIPAGQVSDAPQQAQDWLPTFAEMAGVPAPARTDGVSLLPALGGKPGGEPSTVYCEYSVFGKMPDFPEFEPFRRSRPRGQMQQIRIGDFVGVRYQIKSHADPFEIYDVKNDPGQAVNLAAKKPDLQQAMHDAVLRLRKSSPEARRPYDSEMVPALSAGAKPRMKVAWFDGEFPWLPRLDDLKPTVEREISSLAESAGKHAACLVSGVIVAPVDGEYTIVLKVDAPAFLRVHDIALIDAGFGKPAQQSEAKIRLKKGAHPLRLYRAAGKSGAVTAGKLLWKLPGPGGFTPVFP